MAPSAGTDIRVIEGIGEKTMRKLIAHGFTSLEKLVATPETVTDVPVSATKRLKSSSPKPVRISALPRRQVSRVMMTRTIRRRKMANR